MNEPVNMVDSFKQDDVMDLTGKQDLSLSIWKVAGQSPSSRIKTEVNHPNMLLPPWMQAPVQFSEQVQEVEMELSLPQAWEMVGYLLRWWTSW